MGDTFPAEGERRAIGGYYPQYSIAASLILRALRLDQLQWIRLADPKAGHVDDFQLRSSNRIDALQVKWAKYGGILTFKDLIAGSQKDKSPSLIAQLAHGWQELHNIYPGMHIVVHLVTNKRPSVSDNVLGGKQTRHSVSEHEAEHFAVFLNQAWFPFHYILLRDRSQIPIKWQTTWEQLQQVSGLLEHEFDTFVRDCELEFGYPSPFVDEIEGNDNESDQRESYQQVRDLEHFLIRSVASPENIVEFTRAQLLNRLGWSARSAFTSRHEFPVNEQLYVPLASSVEALEHLLSSVPGGYIGVFGSPGSGKSTLLTQTLRQSRKERVIRYYAYVPDAQDPSVLRGESVHFLHDVTHALDQAGFVVGKSLSTFDRAQLLERFQQQLTLLHENWQKTSQKTILLIDGLDHIEREIQPHHSLLRDLPLPEQIPAGVYIILGSQTAQLQNLPPGVQAAITHAERRVELRSLLREEVMHILERAAFDPVLNTEQLERLWQLSGGHPWHWSTSSIVLSLSPAVANAISCLMKFLVMMDISSPYTSHIGILSGMMTRLFIY